MKSKYFAVAAFIALAILTFNSRSVVAQEGEMQVIDEVVAQVNDDVITLSMLKREMKERVEALKQGCKTEAQALEEVNKKQAELIAILINEALLLQRGKELDLASDIEAEVNRRFLQIANDQGITTIQKLEEAMRQNGMVPEDVRRTMRAEMMKQAVLQQEVDRRVYLGFSTKEIKDYFDAHPDKFRKPEQIKLSEIYIYFTGKDEAAVRARALELVSQIRAGADFKALAMANSEREKNGQRTAPTDGGYVGEFDFPNLREDLVNALKDVKIGGITDPIKTGDGFQILRVDGRTPPAATPTFNDNRVREAMLGERQTKEREAFVQNLRNEAFIKITESYKAGVEPLLKISAPVAAKTQEKGDNKKPKKP